MGVERIAGQMSMISEFLISLGVGEGCGGGGRGKGGGVREGWDVGGGVRL